MKHIYYLFLFLLIFSCKRENDYFEENISSNSSSEDYDQSYNEEENYNGTYCAEVEYYNPNTGSRNTYDLDVEVEDGYLVQINWPNGGCYNEGYRLRNRVNEDTENTTCPICGGEKSEYDDHCSSCQRRLEEEGEEMNYEY